MTSHAHNKRGYDHPFCQATLHASKLPALLNCRKDLNCELFNENCATRGAHATSTVASLFPEFRSGICLAKHHFREFEKARLLQCGKRSSSSENEWHDGARSM